MSGASLRSLAACSRLVRGPGSGDVLSGARRALATSSPTWKQAVDTEGETKRVVDDGVLHTGQQFHKDDIRMARFMHHPKEVNSQWAIDLIKELPPIEVNQRVVACDGGGGALGHPRVYINLDSHEPVSCIYCGRRYVFKKKEED